MTEFSRFKTLWLGARGPQTQLLQLALARAGYAVVTDGIFGPKTDDALQRFQSSRRLTPDGIAGPITWRALLPFLTGYIEHTVRASDTLWKLAQVYGSSVAAIETANPDINETNLTIGQTLVVPLGFDVVPTTIRFSSVVLDIMIDGLTARYPFLRYGAAGVSVMGRPIALLSIGEGTPSVFYNAAHHANEWITTPLVMQFLEQYASATASGDEIFGVAARELYQQTTLSVAPMVNPDGVDLVTGELSEGSWYEQARSYAANYPAIRFPLGWKANINGVDLNLQYPAGWENARSIKFEQGYTSPAPRDYVGSGPLVAPESRAIYEWTRANDFFLTLSFHTQGKVIYWKYLDFEPKNSYDIALEFAEVSGYAIEQTPYASGFAGYKDWFIAAYDRPGYTIEAGEGISPLPLQQFLDIYNDCLGILVSGMTAAFGYY